MAKAINEREIVAAILMEVTEETADTVILY